MVSVREREREREREGGGLKYYMEIHMESLQNLLTFSGTGCTGLGIGFLYSCAGIHRLKF
jgi:hypothetical protein